MNHPRVLRSMPRRLTALVALAVLASAASLPATALAAPRAVSTTTSCATTQCVITVGDGEITKRLTALNTLSGKIAKQLSAGHLTSGQASSLQGDATNNQNGLTALKTRLDAETNITAARQDVRSIYTRFRIYAVVLPRDYNTVWLDVLQNLDGRLRAAQPKIEYAIQHAPASERGQLDTRFGDYKAQLAEGESQMDAAQGQIATLTPANFDNARPVFTTAWQDFRSDMKTAHSDIHQAAADLHQISRILKAGASASSTPGSSATSSSNA